jgi:H+/Cl- antiporter ClcA
VLFAAPLGGAVFALEILHRKGLEYYEALVPAAIGSVAGYGVYTAATGWGLQPIWRFPAPPLHLTMADLGWAAVCGVAGALVAAIFTATTLLARAAFRPLPPWARPVVAGALLGAVAFISPFGLTYAEFQLGGFARLPHVAVATLLLAVLGHLLSATITMAGGWKGGFIIPLFFMGYCLGRAASGWLPGADELVLATAMMVACNVGVTKTPLGSTLVVAGMAGMRLLPTMLIAALVSLLLTSGVGLLESQRSRGRDATAPRLAGGPGLEGAPA